MEGPVPSGPEKRRRRSESGIQLNDAEKSRNYDPARTAPDPWRRIEWSNGRFMNVFARRKKLSILHAKIIMAPTAKTS